MDDDTNNVVSLFGNNEQFASPSNGEDMVDENGTVIDSDWVLSEAIDADLASVLVLGYTDDDRVYFSSSVNNRPEMLYLLELAKRELMNR